MRETAFHFLRLIRGVVFLILNLVMACAFLAFIALTIGLIIAHTGKSFVPMLIMDIIMFLIGFGCFILKFKYDTLILKLQPDSVNLTLFQ